MNTSPYPIYIISLKRNPERRLYMQRQLDALGLNYRFVDAVDKNDLESQESRAEIARRLDIDEYAIEHTYARGYHNNYACSLSHVKAYNLMEEYGDIAACILEDDILISDDFSEILRAAQQIPWDILMLSSQSRTTGYIPGTNAKIQKSMEESPEIDCSLFPNLRKVKWYKRLLPPIATSSSQVDWRFIPKLEWCLMMLLSRSRFFNNLFKYFITVYRYLLVLYNSDHHIVYINREEYKKEYAACKIGGIPIRSSQQTLYKGYDIAIPAEMPTSGMGYLLTSTMVKKWKATVNFYPEMAVDFIPWFLQKKYGIRLRIVTPPCVTASLTYLKHSSRMG